MLVPVPQPELFSGWLQQTWMVRNEAMGLKQAGFAATMDSVAIRKRFMGDEGVRAGMEMYFSGHPDEIVWKMHKFLGFAFQPASLATIQDVAAFWNPSRANVWFMTATC